MNLKQIYESSVSLISKEIPDSVINNLKYIGTRSFTQKGVYTVLVTLLYYKHLYPKQDIRLHQAQLEGGFSGRSFDTMFVTPVLKELGLPSMSESGWLTRSLEQSYPYDYNYNGKISGGCKMPFLELLDYVQENPNKALEMLQNLFYIVRQVVDKNVIKITPLEHKENLTIDKIICALDTHFNKKYKTHNGAKLPVLAFYAIYKSIISEMSRYSGCELAPLASLTACDKSSKASGDIEIFHNGKHFESVEIKLDRQIDKKIVRVVEEKIYKFNPKRYYILSYYGVLEDDNIEIQKIVDNVRQKHGCQIIINGLLPTIKYYLRLISNLSDFVETYNDAIMKDKELQLCHKKAWNEIVKTILSS